VNQLRKGSVLGCPVTVGNLTLVSDHIINAAKQEDYGYVCIANVHMVTTARRDMRLRPAMEGAGIVTSDGMPLVWELRRQGYDEAERVAGPDLLVLLCELAQEEELPVYFFGGSVETIKRLQAAVAKRFPSLKVAGYESPPMIPQFPEVEPEVIERIKTSGAKIVFVGLGCPKQEFWMGAYSPHLPAVLIGVGAAFDFLAGTKQRAPGWMQRAGLEWLFRLASEPGRLWKRYLVTNSLFLWYLMRERF